MATLEQEKIRALQEALVWCSGASDFAPGGKAHEGWVKTCRPLIATRPEDMKIPNREERAMGLPMMDEACEAKRQPLVTDAVANLVRAVEHLEKVIADTEQRLGAVLRPPEKGADKAGEALKSVVEVPLVLAIRELALKVERAGQYLAGVRDRLEV